MAENALMYDELQQFLSTKTLINADSRAFTYGDGPSGASFLKIALANFFNNHFHPVNPVEQQQLMITNGVTSAIEHSAWTIENAGEGILVGRPYYRAFGMDMELRPGVKMVPVSFDQIDPCGIQCVAKYEEALLASNLNGVNIRAIMLCHPHNPLGRCYDEETIIRLMKLYEKYQIHLISDEIYALSVWDNTIDRIDARASKFASVLSINTEGIINPDLVHILWGTSKDFGANGLRIGVIISQGNSDFLSACRACAIFSSPSSLAENAVAQILCDQSFLTFYIAENRKRLSKAYAYAVERLNHYGIEYLPGATAAFFLWIKLGRKSGLDTHMIESTIDSNTTFQRLLNKRVFVVDGVAAGAEQPGWFRLVFAQRQGLIDETIKRIAEVLNE